MKKTIGIILAILVALALAVTTVACTENEIDYANIETVAVDESSVADSFLLSEFDISKVILNVKYLDTVSATGGTVTGDTVQIPADLNMVKAEDKAKLSIAGEHNITLLVYGKFTVQFKLRLIENVSQKYMVRFFDHEGNALGDPQFVEPGRSAVRPSLPTIEGQTFIGWRDRETGNWASYDNVTRNMNLEAVYAPNTYSVGFYTLINGEETEIATVNVPRGANAYNYAPEIPILVGYSNGRWENINAMNNIDGDKKFYAIYDADQVQITFNYKRFSSVGTDFKQGYDVGGQIANPPPAEYAGFKFVEWQIDGKKAEFPYTVTVETTFTAVYVDMAKGNDGLIYAETSGGLEVIGYDGKEDVVVIPRYHSFNGVDVPVVEIRNGVFKDYEIKEFAVSSDNRRFITEDGVLYNADKTELIAYPTGKSGTSYRLAPTTTEIYPYAFYGSYLTEVVLNDDLKIIGDYAFAENNMLSSLFVTSNVEKIGAYAFASTDADNALTVLSFTNASSLTEIGNFAFKGLAKLAGVELPPSLKTLGRGVFDGCKSMSYVSAAGSTDFRVINGVLYSYDRTKLYLYPAVSAATNPQYVIDAACTEVVAGAFGHARLSGITVQSALLVDDNAFNCPNLIDFVITDGASVTPKQGSSFIGCFGGYPPHNFYVSATNPSYPALFSDFGGVSDFADVSEWRQNRIYADGYVYEIYDYTEEVSGSMVRRTGARILGSSLTDSVVIIPDVLNNVTVTAIAPYAFAEDNFIEELTVPANLLTIGERAFYGMEALSSLILNDTLTEVGDEAFKNCRALSSVRFGENLNGIRSFGKRVFENTPFLNSSASEYIMVGSVLVKYNGFSETVSVRSDIEYIAPDAFLGRGEIISLSFEGLSIKYIAEDAFRFCTGIREITFPASLRRVDAGAFAMCGNLSAVSYNVASDDENLSVADGAYPTGVLQVYTDSDLFTVVYQIEENYAPTVSGIIFEEGYDVENTATERFAGWYFDRAFTELVTFPFNPHDYPDKVAQGNTIRMYARMRPIDEGSAGLVYRLNDDGDYTVIGYEGTDEYVIVPVRYRQGYVKEIGAGAFGGDNASRVKELILPTGRSTDGSIYSELSYIGEDAFKGTAWYERFSGDFVIADDFLIEYRGNAKEVVVPSYIRKVAKGAFKNNNDVEKITFPSGIYNLDDEVMYGCGNLREVVLPNEVTTIGARAFADCPKLRTVNFADCTSIYSVKSDAFDNTAWLNNYVGSVITINDILYKYVGNGDTLHIYNGIRMIGERAFADNDVIRYVYIPQSVVTIGESAFENSSITDVNLYASGARLTDVRENAFAGCGNLKLIDLSLAHNLIYIGDGAFGVYEYVGAGGEKISAGCSSLTEISIPSSLTYLGVGAFRKSGLRTVVFAADGVLEEIGEWAFAECNSLFSVNFSGSSALREIGDYAFYNCRNLRNFVNSLGAVQRLGAYSFYNCESLVNFSINEVDLREIGDMCLENVGYVNTDTNMVVIGNILVKYNGFDTVVNIPSNITTIYNGAFMGNTRITEVIFPEDSRILNVNSRAFYGCANLKDINFPLSIVYVGEEAVAGTEWFDSQVREGKEFIMISNTLVKYTYGGVKQVILPAEAEIISDGAFDGATVYDIVIGENVKRIERGAFSGIIGGNNGEWTLTVLAEVPPAIYFDTDNFSASKILMPDQTFIETYRLDEKWLAFYGKMEVAVKHTVTFITEADKSLDVESGDYYAIYAPIQVTTINDGEEIFMFTGWYLDEEKIVPVTYPYIIERETVLYADYVSTTIGTSPGDFYMEGNEIKRYVGTQASTVVIIGSLSGVDATAITSDFIIDNENGTYIKDGDEYIFDAGATAETKYSLVGAFEGHKELTEIYFSKGSKIETIGSNAFKNCSNVKKIVLPSSVKVIESGAFEGCSALEELVFAPDCTDVKIMGGAFKGCVSLRSVTLPKGIAFLGNGAFAGCENLVDIYMESESAILLTDDDGNDLMPFDIVAGLRIHVPYNSYNSYLEYWKDYEAYLEEGANDAADENE